MWGCVDDAEVGTVFFGRCKYVVEACRVGGNHKGGFFFSVVMPAFRACLRVKVYYANLRLWAKARDAYEFILNAPNDHLLGEAVFRHAAPADVMVDVPCVMQMPGTLSKICALLAAESLAVIPPAR